MPISAKAVLEARRVKKERQVHRVNSASALPTMFRLLVTRIFHFFMLLYLFPKQVVYGHFSQRSEAINKHS